jgi:ParB-like chromosome segregation protein Spo0J
MPGQNAVVSSKELTKSDSRVVELPLERQLDSAAVATVSLRSLRGTASPRLSGESMEHIRLLAQADVLLPPIIIHRQTMRVIDGMHRVRAARLRGEQEIPALFYDGTEADAFVLAVKVNRAHGLPLSLADRKAAAVRIIATHSRWSDRAIADVTALSHKTVGTIRRGLNGEIRQMDARIGQDGRVRPLNAALGRRRAAELLTDHPGASLRQVAAAAGISPETARDVRTRLLHGSDPLLPRQRKEGRELDPQPLTPTCRRDKPPQRLADTTGNPVVIARKLRRDPALRSSESIQVLVRLLALQPADPAQWRQLASDVPSRWAAPVATAAAECARAWDAFAAQVRERAGA